MASINFGKFICPACNASLQVIVPPDSLDLRCPKCAAELVFRPRHQNLFVLACVVLAAIVARNEAGPLFVAMVCILSAVFLLLGSAVLGRLRPMELKLAHRYFETLRVR
jgi:hypothetical protein